jgi:release factor glutamine methyltransferase
VAKKNATNQQIKNIEFIQSDLFGNININEKFDIIISNPPYISKKEFENLSLFTKKQPKEALITQNNGYFFYQEIFRQAHIFLTKKFLLIMEIGYQQEKEVIKLLIDYFPNTKVSIFSDYVGYSRVAAIYY